MNLNVASESLKTVPYQFLVTKTFKSPQSTITAERAAGEAEANSQNPSRKNSADTNAGNANGGNAAESGEKADSGDELELGADEVLGRCHWWNQKKGFGILLPDGEEDEMKGVFCHQKQLQIKAFFKQLFQGDEVVFKLGMDQRQRVCATEVRLLREMIEEMRGEAVKKGGASLKEDGESEAGAGGDGAY